jgi:ornithine cyclodeaminase
MSADGLRIVGPAEVAAVADLALAWRASTGAFAAVADGAATVPSPMALELPDAEGEVHVKGAWLRGRPTWTVKVATGFYGGAGPSGGGLAVCGSARDGRLLAVLDDRGLLTDLRTAAAGALATDLLARADATRLAVLGAGTQARLHVAALLAVRPLSAVTVWARRPEAAAGLARALAEAHGLATEVASSPAAAVADADTVICATPSRAPLLDLADVRPGTHVTALGSDAPGKRELSSRLVPAPRWSSPTTSPRPARSASSSMRRRAGRRRSARCSSAPPRAAAGRAGDTVADLSGHRGPQDRRAGRAESSPAWGIAEPGPRPAPPPPALRPATGRRPTRALRRLARRAYSRYVARIGAPAPGRWTPDRAGRCGPRGACTSSRATRSPPPSCSPPRRRPPRGRRG